MLYFLKSDQFILNRIFQPMADIVRNRTPFTCLHLSQWFFVFSFIICLWNSYDVMLNIKQYAIILGPVTGSTLWASVKAFMKAINMFSDITRSEDENYTNDILPADYIVELPERIVTVFYCFVFIILSMFFYQTSVAWAFFLYLVSMFFIVIGLYFSICRIDPKLKQTKIAIIVSGI